MSPTTTRWSRRSSPHGETRDAARRRLIRALEETAFVGPASNARFLIDALAHDDFAAGAATTAFIDEAWPSGYVAAPLSDAFVALAAAIALTADRDAAAAAAGLVGCDQLGWRSDGAATSLIALVVGGARRVASSRADRIGLARHCRRP